ncbi:MAG: S16 family serine protease [archaeon]
MNSSKNSVLSNTIRILLIILVLALLVTPVFAVLENGNIKIFAITDDQKGMAADLYMYAIPGTGKAAFVTSTSLVGKDTQTTGNIALEIAQSKTGVKISDKDMIFDIRANASEVDGPSAGAAMTLLSYSMLFEKPIPTNVALTGTISSDGSIGMVGGVGAKAQAASKVGIKLFMIPTGEAVSDIETDGTFETVNMLEYGPKNLGMKIVEVSTIDQAINYAYSNIDSIVVDSNISIQMFIPEPILYDFALTPMKGISQEYISDAKTAVTSAKKALDESSLPDTTLADLYQQYGTANRGVEMAKRFFDQNYLYSAANYAFNSRVLAGAIDEIAKNPSLLSADTIVLNSKIFALRKELDLVKQKSNFVSQDGFEWVVGAQQRLAYAKNALDKLNLTDLVVVSTGISDSSQTTTAVKQGEYFQRVYDYVSAVSWINVAKDFTAQAGKSPDKKIPLYSSEFIDSLDKKISETELLIKDSNISQESIAEATRRLDSAKISRDSNFLFAALYDAYFAESFVNGELTRKELTSDELFGVVEKDINSGSKSDSIWANIYFDHAKFYFQNALFNKKLERSEEVTQSLETSYDLLYLSKNLNKAKAIVEEYIAFTSMQNYVINEPVIGVTYVKKTEDNLFQVVLLIVLVLLFALLLIVLVSVMKSRNSKLTLESRNEKLMGLFSNLNKALSKKKISGSEYFTMRKKYESELSHRPDIKAERLAHNLSPSDLKARLAALQKGMFDLRRHYKEGIILSEDYLKQYREVSAEINEVKNEIISVQKEIGFEKKAKKFKSAANKIKIKGTLELTPQELKEDAKANAKSKKVIRRYAYGAQKREEN